MESGAKGWLLAAGAGLLLYFSVIKDDPEPESAPTYTYAQLAESAGWNAGTSDCEMRFSYRPPQLMSNASDQQYLAWAMYLGGYDDGYSIFCSLP